MHFVFIKGSGKHDRMDVVRDGAVAESVNCPKQGILPHDMVHFAVESTLEKRGFVTRVREGEAANFRMMPDAESDSVERLVEVFQGDGWSGWGSSPADMLDLYQVTCRARACVPLAVTAEDVLAVRERILALTAQWQALPVGGSLAVRFERDGGAA